VRVKLLPLPQVVKVVKHQHHSEVRVGQ
jgi:hypothetical protein